MSWARGFAVPDRLRAGEDALGMRPLLVTVFNRTTGERTVREFQSSPVRIGRHARNHLALSFPFVSTWHAIVEFDDHRLVFTDVGSTNGTQIAGQRVESGVPVRGTDDLSVLIGSVELTFLRPPPSGASAFPSDHQRADEGSRERTSLVNMQKLHAAIESVRTLDERRHALDREISALLETAWHSMNQAERAAMRSMLQEKIPTLGRGAGPFAVSGAPGTAAGGHATARQLIQSLCPNLPPPQTAAEEHRMLARIEDVLRTTARSFLELLKGHRQFGDEVGIRTVREETSVHRATTPEQLLESLLSGRTSGDDLNTAYRELMVHHIGLIRAVLDGVRAVLVRIDPHAIERETVIAWPRKSAAMWSNFARRHQVLMEDDRKLAQLLFGPEFAQAYADATSRSKR